MLFHPEMTGVFLKKQRRAAVLPITALAAFFIFTNPAFAAPSTFGTADAGEKKVFGTGSARGTVTSTYDETSRKDVLDVSYFVQPGSPLHVSLKGFPAGLNPAGVSAVRAGVSVPSGGQAAGISVTLEVKGTKAVQSVPLRLKQGWSTVQKPVEWSQIGDLTEVVFVIVPSQGVAEAKGTLYFSLDFVKAVVPSPATGALTSGEAQVVRQSAALKTAALAGQDTGKKYGISEIGAAKGNVSTTFDTVAEKDVLDFGYTLPAGSSIQVWTKNFPADMSIATANTAKINVRLPDAGQANRISLQADLKGVNGVQSVPVALKSGFNSSVVTIDWEKIGVLREVVFTFNPVRAIEPVKGGAYLSVDFIKAGAPKKGPASSAPIPFSLMDAGEKGVFNIGPSQGTIGGAFDEAVMKDTWKFSYTLPVGAVVGVWSKGFHPDLNSKTADSVAIGVKVPEAGQVNQVAVKVEIKGSRGMQSIPLSLKSGRNVIREPINWNTIGELNEAVFVVSPMAANPAGDNPLWFNPTESGPAAKAPVGTLYFDLEFRQMTFLQKFCVFVKTGALVLFALALALLGFMMGRTVPKQQGDHKPVPSGILRDLLYGALIVLTIGLALYVYSSGAVNPLDIGFGVNFLVVGLLGALIAELLKLALTGKHLTSSEIFQDILLCGMLAISSSRLEILQAPSNWAQLLMISNFTASIAFLLYHLFNANALMSSGKHLNAPAGAMIVGTPYIFGWLLLLENPVFLQKMAGGLFFGTLAAWPLALEALGRVIVVLGFNEAITNGIGLVTKGRPVKTWKAHLFILLTSVAVVVSPLIADLGSTPAVGALPFALRALVAVLTTMLSFAGLWGEVYLITGILLDAGKRAMPTAETLTKHVGTGMKKGLAYSGILMALLYVISLLFNTGAAQKIMASAPLAIGVLGGALIFPLVKTIIETFDGSLPFFERLAYSYRNWTLYLRGAVAGFGFSFMITQGMFQKEMSERINFGCMIGLAASMGVSILRDIVYGIKRQGRVQTWRLYLVDGLLGAFVGSAAAFYLDSLQVPVIIEKFKLYVSAGFESKDYITYPLLNKWGKIDIGDYTGGVKLLYTESLAGVINWAVAAWLFAINKVFMQAYFDKDKTPIKFFFSKAGLAQLTEMMIYVLRWGLWMSPIIFTFLRMMPNPTWYNQDGAIRTLFATWNNLTMSPQAFEAWSLKTFIALMAFDIVRILIWMDHMGLRVATLVNLSFLGMDKLDEKIAKFIGPAVAQRYIPEGVKRFTTWAPLLIPFYIPRGEKWEYAWNTAEAIQNANKGKGIIPFLQGLPLSQMLLLIVAAVLVGAGFSVVVRALNRRSLKRRVSNYELGNREYKVTLRENGEVYSEVIGKESDVSRRAYDGIDPCGRILYLLDAEEAPESKGRAWPVAGNFPEELFDLSVAEKGEDSLRLANSSNGVKTTVEITLPDQDSTAEVWAVTLENLSEKPRRLKVVPYLEWVLNGWMHDRFHTQYQRLYPEMEYVSAGNAIITANKSTKSMGFLASEIAPEGFLTGRVDFIGRARSVWSPRALETLDFLEAKDTPACPTFDPIGSMLIPVDLGPKAKKTLRLMIGFCKKKDQALGMIAKVLKPQPAAEARSFKARKHDLLIGHGEIPSGTPQPYYEYKDDGNKLLVKTPYTPRPFDHGMSNTIHSVMVTNRGLHTSCNGNSQQNRLTPDWPDTVTREVPSEAIYLYEEERGEWYSPTHHPLNDPKARNESEFSVDGTSVFRMSKGDLATELTVFVPTKDPMGVYLLTVRNHADYTRKIRVAPYFQVALAFQPERSGPLVTRYDKTLDALFFENPRNIFRTGTAFASLSIPAERAETKRGRFFGSGRGVKHPFLVEKGEADVTQLTDSAQIASFLGTLNVPARGECTVAIVLGQADEKKEALRLVQKYKNLETVRKTLDETRKWWLGLMGTARVQTNQPEFDRYLNWLKYQALAERIWARRGFYQTSGAYGFRDQLQDTVNLTWVDPALARKQIILHASQQFIEGDVFHWFFTLTDGRSAFSCRSHASDNLLWIAWGVGEYVRITGDDTILDEMTSYVASEFPFAPLPKNKHGWGALYGRSTRADTVYRHCMRSIDIVLGKRMGRNGLPLMGVGDWNDGLDEIGAKGKGESVWLGFFLYYILKEMLPVIERKDGVRRRDHYAKKMKDLAAALEKTWRTDRYLRAIHDDGTEIGVKDSGVWEIDALTAAWSVMTGINFERGLTIFNTALSVLERGSVILLGWPALREDTKPYLGRSSKYPEGVRENGMYCHGVQWLIRAARLLAEEFEKRGDKGKADEYRATAYRLWLKISPLAHVIPGEIEIYGGQPNKQPADFLTTFESGRMIWNGYTGAAGWMLRQAFEGVVGATLVHNELLLPDDLEKARGALKVLNVHRDVSQSPFRTDLQRPNGKVGVLPPELQPA